MWVLLVHASPAHGERAWRACSRHTGFPSVPPSLSSLHNRPFHISGGTGHRSSNAGSYLRTLHRAAQRRRKEIEFVSSSSEQCPLLPQPPPPAGPGGFPLEFHVDSVPETATLRSLYKWATRVLFFSSYTSPSMGEKDSRNMQETRSPRHVWAGCRTTDSGPQGGNAPLTLPSSLQRCPPGRLTSFLLLGMWGPGKDGSGHLERRVHIRGLPFTSYMIGEFNNHLSSMLGLLSEHSVLTELISVTSMKQCPALTTPPFSKWVSLYQLPREKSQITAALSDSDFKEGARWADSVCPKNAPE